jgi:lysophospholipase L1-like esterase
MLKKFLLLVAVLIAITSFKTPPQRMLFIGDSLTCYKYGWQHQVAVAKGNNYLNLAVSGTILSQMKTSLNAQMKKDAVFATAFIYGGCNDGFCYVDLDQSLKYTQMMVDTCNARGIKPVVVIGFDAEKVIKKTIYNEEITVRSRNRYALLQKKMKEQLKNCLIVPVNPNFYYEDTSDGIHFMGTGHKKMADWVLCHL